MELNILEKKENKVLNRTEVKFNCLYEGEATPKLLSVKSKLVAMLNTKKELIVVDSIQPHFGESKAAGYAKIYDSEDNLKSIETKHVIGKNQEAEAPVEEDQAEKSTEEESTEEKSTEEESTEEKPSEEESTEENPSEDKPAEEESSGEDVSSDEISSDESVEEESTEEE